jgi:hypothetical protein
MTEQTQPETDPYLDLISPEVREEYVSVANAAAAFDEQIAVLQRHRRALIDERQAILDMAVADATDDATIVALRKSGDAGAQRLLDEVRGISPMLYDYIEWTSRADEQERPGPYVSLLNHRERPLDSLDPADLAAVMIEFARRFCPDPPAVGSAPGMVVANLMTDSGDGLTIHYTPDGSDAWMFPHRERTGTLLDICGAAIREAIRLREADDHDF